MRGCPAGCADVYKRQHQDRLGQGNALTKEQHEEDVAFIREVGANTVRLAHYPVSYTHLDVYKRQLLR